MNAYWYRCNRSKRVHVVFASCKAIAQWYVSASSTWLYDPVYIRKDNRPLQTAESYSVLAHSADTVLVSSIAELQVNGSSSEYLARLNKLAERINQ